MSAHTVKPNPDCSILEVEGGVAEKSHKSTLCSSYQQNEAKQHPSHLRSKTGGANSAIC